MVYQIYTECCCCDARCLDQDEHCLSSGSRVSFEAFRPLSIQIPLDTMIFKGHLRVQMPISLSFQPIKGRFLPETSKSLEYGG